MTGLQGEKMDTPSTETCHSQFDPRHQRWVLKLLRMGGKPPVVKTDRERRCLQAAEAAER